MHWLSKVSIRIGRFNHRRRLLPYEQQPAWGRSREFDITTRSVSRHGMTERTTGDLEDEEEEEDNGGFSTDSHRKKRKGMSYVYLRLLIALSNVQWQSYPVSVRACL